MFLRLLSYPRSIIAVLYFPFHTVFCSSIIILLNILFNKRSFEDVFAIFWAKFTCRMFGVKVKVFGVENLPPGGFIYVFNHASFFDIFSMSGYLGSFRFGAKIELFKIPIFGYAMRRAGILPIARQRRDEVFKVYAEAEKRIRSGERFALSPEGTRQETEKLGAFKSGPFVFAINAKAPLVPVVVKGAAAILPKGHTVPNWGVWSREIELHILPAVDASEYSLDQRPALQERVRNMMVPFFTLS